MVAATANRRSADCRPADGSTLWQQFCDSNVSRRNGHFTGAYAFTHRCRLAYARCERFRRSVDVGQSG